MTVKTKETINNIDFKDKSRKNETDFTRNRKMPFEDLMLFMIFSFKSSTASALRRFFDNLQKPTHMTQQSLSEARTKVTVEAFRILFDLTVETMTEHYNNKWHGYRIYAIDGSKINLPADKKLSEHYGTIGRGHTSPAAQGSVLYDVLNDIVADAVIGPVSTDERTMAKTHIEACKHIAAGDRKLLIFDRGYASFDIIETLENAGLHYLMRVRTKFNLDIDAQTAADGFVSLKQGEKNIRVRVIKFKLASGEEEVLITNITDKRLGVKAFKKLYFMRWPVETKYDMVKNKLQFENFNTRTVEGIQQDFYAVMYLTNFAASAATDANDDIAAARSSKNNKYEYKANMNELIGILKDRFVFALSQDSEGVQAAMIDDILNEVMRYVIPVRPGRFIPRKLPRKSKFHHNRKFNC